MRSASKNFTNIGFDSRDQYVALGSGLNNDWIDNGWRFNDSVSIEKGRNSFKFVSDYRIQQFSPISFSNTYPWPRSRADGIGIGSQFGARRQPALQSLLLGQVSTGNFGAGVEFIATAMDVVLLCVVCPGRPEDERQVDPQHTGIPAGTWMFPERQLTTTSNFSPTAN